MFYIQFFYWKKEWIAHFLFFGERCGRIAEVAHQKWATMRDSLRSLRENKQSWANCSGRSPKMSERVNRSFFEGIAHSLIFGQNTSDSLGKPMSEFPALGRTVPVFKIGKKVLYHSTLLCSILNSTEFTMYSSNNNAMYISCTEIGLHYDKHIFCLA